MCFISYKTNQTCNDQSHHQLRSAASGVRVLVQVLEGKATTAIIHPWVAKHFE